MLTAIELQNFKGVGERQRVELRPLTLIFGPNNAGKSTLLQALLYMHEVIAHGTADVGVTNLGGEVVDLGGFERLVHQHDQTRTMVLRAEFTTPAQLDRFNRELPGFPFPDLDDLLQSAWLELTIKWTASPQFTGPVVERAVVGAGEDSIPLVWLELTEVGPTFGKERTLSARLNLGHPLLSGADEDAVGALSAWEEHAWHPDAFLAPGAGYGGDASSGAGLGEGSDSDDGRRHAVFALVRSRYSALPSPSEPLRLVPTDDSLEARVATDQVRALLEMLICGTTAQLMSVLQATLYLGPLRSIPSRGFLYARSGRRSSWADGLGAWDALLADSTMLLEVTNRWLERLGAGCTVVLQRLRVIDATQDDANEGGTSVSPSRSRSRADARSASSEVSVAPSARRLLLKTANGALVLPSELGAGISQLLPVVVAAATSEARLCMLEQPELHVHPALQVGLGDLFMQAVAEARGRRAFMIETHSEHLILRVLKRIRQTTDDELPEGVERFDREQLSVIYVDSVDGEVLIRRLEVDAQGEFVDRWPRGFFAERMEELL